MTKQTTHINNRAAFSRRWDSGRYYQSTMKEFARQIGCGFTELSLEQAIAEAGFTRTGDVYRHPDGREWMME